MAAPMARTSPRGFRERAAPLLPLMRQIPAMAITKPRKNLFPGLSPLRRKKLKIAVKNGAMEIITPTLEASVYVSAMFSIK